MIKNTIQKVVIVGSGITGCISASLIKNDTLQISILDKGRGAGGRMSTSRSQNLENNSVDLGAQYITASKEYFALHKKFYNELLNDGVLKPLESEIVGHSSAFPDGAFNFVTPKGMSSLVKYYLNKSGCEAQYNERVRGVSEVAGRWQVTTESGQTQTCDSLVLTMPVPQILELTGGIRGIIDANPEVKEKLEKVSYSSRFAVGLFYDKGTTINVPWAAKYIQGDPCICYVAVDSKKRGLDGDVCGPSVVVHAKVPFSLSHLEEDLESVCSQYLVPALHKLVPELPHTAAEVKNHRWRYSQVHQGYEGSPGAVVLQEKPLLVLAGDAFTKSGFDGCLDSALKVQTLINSASS